MKTVTDLATDGSAVAESNVPQRFLELLAARDFEPLAKTLTSDATARFLLPHGLEEYAGGDAIVGRIKSWFESASGFDLATSSEERIGQRQRLSWRFSVVRDGRSEVIEQLVFLDIGDRGFQLEPGATTGRVEVFEAGTMGCADGLAQEFRRRIAEVPIGGSLEVVVSDPAAKEDLPSLARLLGQRVTSTEAHDDGRLTITVERQK